MIYITIYSICIYNYKHVFISGILFRYNNRKYIIINIVTICNEYYNI